MVALERQKVFLMITDFCFFCLPPAAFPWEQEEQNKAPFQDLLLFNPVKSTITFS